MTQHILANRAALLKTLAVEDKTRAPIQSDLFSEKDTELEPSSENTDFDRMVKGLDQQSLKHFYREIQRENKALDKQNSIL